VRPYGRRRQPTGCVVVRPYGRRAVHRPAVHSVHTAGPAGELLRRQALLLLGQRLRTLVQNPGSVPGPGPGTSRAQQLHPPFQPLRGVRRRAAAHTRAKRRLEHTRGRSGASAARESERAWSSAALAAEACDLDRACAQACGTVGVPVWPTCRCMAIICCCCICCCIIICGCIIIPCGIPGGIPGGAPRPVSEAAVRHACCEQAYDTDVEP
jgi:hypothetical protein